jgi:hypothetical protein
MGAPAQDLVVNLGLIDDPGRSHGLRRADYFGEHRDQCGRSSASAKRRSFS